MKKVNKLPDGTEEVLEGDPEELRKYEDLQKPSQQQPITESPKKPGILHGAEVDGVPLTDGEIELIRSVRQLGKQDLREVQRTYPSPFDPYYPYDDSNWWYRITCGAPPSLEQVTLLQQLDGSSKFSHSLVDVLTGKATVKVDTNETPAGFGHYEMYPKH